MSDLEDLKNQGYDVATIFFERLEPEERDNFAQYLKSEFFRPGEKVKVDIESVDDSIMQVRKLGGDTRVLESLKAVAGKVLEIERVIFINERDVCFKLASSDLAFSAQYFVDSRPTLNMYGIILLHEDRLFAVSMDGQEPPKLLAGYEIQGEVELGFGGVLGVSNRAEFIHFLENDADIKNSLCGEFYISDEGMETWCLSAKAWFSSGSEKELELATTFIEEMIASAPKPN